jgi:hypothetical protein
MVLATIAAVVLVGGVTLLFLSPPVVHVLLDLSGAATNLGVSTAETHRLSDALVFDLLRDGDFTVMLGGATLLTSPERAHLTEVGALMRNVLTLAVIGVLLLLGLSAARRTVVGQAFGDAALLLVAAALVVGTAFAVAFDATFAFAHSLVFAAGTWTFDEATSHLVQLYPTPFWVAAALGFCATLIISGSLAIRANRR